MNNGKKQKWHRWSENEFKQKLLEINPNINISDFTRIRARVKCECNICKYKWEPIADSLIRGRGCPKCAGKVKLNFTEFKKEFNNKNDLNVEILSDFAKKTTDKIECRCKTCGNIWITNVNRLKHGHGCNSCRHTGTSFTEQSILNAFKMRLGDEDVLSRNRSLINYELDIVIPSRNIAFEPGNWNFHKKKLDRDQLKRELCHNIGIRLITIYDNYYEENPPFSTDCIIYDFSLGEYNNRDRLRKLIDDLFLITNISPNLNDNEWNQIQEAANRFSTRKTKKEIISDIEKINPNIMFLQSPSRMHEKVLCECLKCGHKWETSPSYIKSGLGCPECNRFKKRTQEEFELQLNVTNPDLISLEPYKNIITPILFRCNICGHEWRNNPREIMYKNNACPKCKKKKQIKNKLIKNGIDILYEDELVIESLSNHNQSIRYNADEFSWLISRINPNIEILEEYNTINKHISCKCKKCNLIWSPKAQHLLNGHGCPNCNGTIPFIKRQLYPEGDHT